jgi:hypothetical protein
MVVPLIVMPSPALYVVPPLVDEPEVVEPSQSSVVEFYVLIQANLVE